ncbi:MAG: hypothetical protein ACPHIA_06555 [Alphaproteobacteria bacterium]
MAFLAPLLLMGCVKGVVPKEGPPPTRAQATAAATPAPVELVGLGKEDVRDLLGEPQLIRRDGPAEVWQYRVHACILDLFLYEAGAEHRVEYMELRTRPGENFPQERCYEQMRIGKRKAPA